MKSTVKLTTLFGCAILAIAQQAPDPAVPADPDRAPAVPDNSAPKPGGENLLEPIVIKAGHTMQGIPLNTLLEEYGALVGKTMIPAQNLPKVTFEFKTNNDLTYEEAKGFYETLMMQRAIAVIPQGDKFMQVIPAAEVAKTPPAFFKTLNFDDLPDTERPIMGPYPLKHIPAGEALDIIKNMAKSPNAITSVDGANVLFLRDSALNVKRMLVMLEQVDKPTETKEEYELVKIQYANAVEIAAALAGLTNDPNGNRSRINTATSSRTTGGSTSTRTSGGSTSSRGGSTSTRTSGGSTSSRGGSTSSRGGSTSSRLSSIQRGATGTEIPVLGNISITPYGEGNELLLVGERRNLEKAKEVIKKLDVVQPQVLIEAIIIDVALSDTKDFGVSIRQAKQGLVDQGNLSSALASALGPAGFSDTSISGAATGFNYWGFLGNNWEVAVTAIQNDSRVTLHSRPRIQTTHSRPASLFIGDTRPVVTGTITDISGGNSSQYQLQQIGITLDVTPYINEEGLVVMDIYQRIQDIVGSQQINGNEVPITTDRSADAKVAVRDGEMIVLGGFIKTKTTTYEDGVPVLRHIPLLGKLFESTYDKDERNELIVLMRPTVLRTPEAAAIKAISEQENLPGLDLAKEEEERIQKKYRELVDDLRRKRSDVQEEEK